MARLRAGMEAGQPQSDVLSIADDATMEQLKREGRPMAHGGADVPACAPALQDADKTWFSTKLITTSIVDNTASGAKPQTAGAAAIRMATRTSNPELGRDCYAKPAGTGAIAQGGNGGAMEAAAGGENLCGGIVDFLPIREAPSGAPIEFVLPPPGVSAVTEPAAILSTAKHPEAASAFIDVLPSEKGRQLAADMGYLPAHPEVPAPEGFPDRAQIERMECHPTQALADDEADKQRFTELFGNGCKTPPRPHAPGDERILLAARLRLVFLLTGGSFLRLMAAGATGREGLTLAPLLAALSDDGVLRALRRSLETSLASAALATVLGTVLGTGYALLPGFTDIRLKAASAALATVPITIPPHVAAIAGIQSLGRSSALLRTLGLAPPRGSTHPLYPAEGIILLLSIQHAPWRCCWSAPASAPSRKRRSRPPASPAPAPAPSCAASCRPTLAPHLAAVFMLAFVSGLGDFGIPAPLGIPAGCATLPVLIRQRLASFGPSVPRDVAALATVMALSAVAAALLQRWPETRARSRTVGPPSRALALPLGHARPAAEGALPHGPRHPRPAAAVVSTAPVSTCDVTLSWRTLPLGNVRKAAFEQSVTLRAFANSTLAAGARDAFAFAIA